MQLLSTKQVVIRISAIIASAEFVIMLVLGFVPFELNKYAEALLDVMLLTLLSAPATYLWVIKPFVEARDEALVQISHLAFTDPLTQLANRRHFLQHLERAIACCIRHKTYAALMVIDLDGFKLINDAYGHDAGDSVLVEIARRFRASIRSEDIVGRLGGDEFVVLIDRLEADEKHARDKAEKVAEKLIAMTATQIEFNGLSMQVGASVGICLIGFNPLESVTALRKADFAMYQAKKNGKGHAAFSD